MRRSFIETLFPGYFAVVMATGILAVGFQQQGLEVPAWSLFVLAAFAHGVLVVLTVIRSVRFPRALFSDATHHALGFANLTAVAATDVVGVAAALVAGWWTLAWVLWWVSLPMWVVLLYTAVIAAVLRGDKPDLRHGINGTWFMITVSGESIASLAALLLTRTTDDTLAFVALCVFLLGIVLYLIVMTMVFLRWTFRTVDPAEIDPPGWIAAGAVAITALAGADLVDAAANHERILRLVPFIEGLTMMAWATATFWFPLMIAIWVWRYLIERVALRYHPSMWSLVFPLGMYGVASHEMFSVLGVTRFDWLPAATVVLATIAWTLTAAGMAVHLVSSWRDRATQQPAGRG